MSDRAWPARRLGDLAIWMSGGTPSTDNADYWGGDIPWISAASLRDFNIEDSDRRLTALGAAHGTRLAPTGSTIFVVRGMSLKSEFRVGIAQRTVSFGQDCKALVPVDGVDPRYLAWAVKASTPKILSMVDEAGHGTGRLETLLIANHQIGVPSLVEQCRIVEILDAIDDEIRSTADLVTKLTLQRLAIIKQGLAAFARDSPAYSIDGIVSEAILGTTARGATGIEDVTLLKMGSIRNGRIDHAQIEYVSRWLVANIDRITLRPGDLLLNTRNTPELVGKVGVWRGGDIRTVPDNNLLIVRFNKSIEPNYVCTQLAFGEPARRIRGLATGTTSVAAIYWRDLRRIELPVPPLEAQHRFVAAVTRSESSASREEMVLSKLQILKQALMDDLLTGRVRAPVASER